MKLTSRTNPEDIPDNPTPEEVAELDKLMLAHRHLYYSGIGQAITDYEYDLLENRIKKVAPESRTATEVGGYSTDPEIIAMAMKLKSGTL